LCLCTNQDFNPEILFSKFPSSFCSISFMNQYLGISISFWDSVFGTQPSPECEIHINLSYNI